MSEQESGFGSGVWCVVELMGHIKVAGFVTEEEHFGAKMGRIDIPAGGGETAVTQYFGGSSVYRITPVTEGMARAFAANNRPKPIQRYELALSSGQSQEFGGPLDDDDDDSDGDFQF